MIATREVKYAGKTHLKGDELEASVKDAKVLRAAKKAIDAPPDVQPDPPVTTEVDPVVPAPTRVPRYVRRPVVATTATGTPDDPEAVATSGQYGRRDMRAADDVTE